ncbi:MAG: hypothetical protein EAZ65_04180 [Verrucomicrobia bacterium]|nr:MAG: hypothetical protein EAZ84_02440 [Verrucomicrobiota bacterium]TAE88566.1 MAG: hypothetical protein EAZ82_04860 [Verrucomicrobiota bacterium]TAF27021.1 MAG: hypothetical protein EAZ71_04175 [Verrucomicrobiota bacterium]TAF42277.1 MAG: hypothetical protein EAZ65_04180 [Verrucomicrobiota bacterium]
MKNRRNPFLRPSLFLSAITVLVPAPAAQAANTVIVWGNAATPTNYNTGTFDWNTATNWAAGAGPVPTGSTTVAHLKGNTAQTITLNLSSPITIGAISRTGQTNFILTGSAITMDGTGILAQGTINGADPAVFLNGEAAISSNMINTTYGDLNVKSNIVMLNTNLGIGGYSSNGNSRNSVTIGGTITNGDSATRQLNIRGGAGIVAYNTQVTGAIGATLGAGGGGIAIQNLITGTSPVNLQGAIGGDTGTGAAITISNAATGTGAFNISGALGQSVSSVTQNTRTSNTTLSGNNASFGGTITVSSGVLSFLNTAAKSGTTTVENGATLGLWMGAATNPFLPDDVDNLFANTLGGVSMGATANVGIDTTNGNFSYDSDVASTTEGLNKLGGNTLTLTGTNAYTGVTTITAGTLSVETIGNGGEAGNLGQATNAASNLVFNGGTLKYTGANATSDRAFTITAGTIATVETSSHLSLPGATGTATTGNLTKTGSGVLTLTGVNTYSGITRVSAGTLSIASNASFTTTVANNTSLSVGNVAGKSLLHIQSGGAGTASRLQVGTVNGGNGAIYNQGTLTVNGTANLGNFALGYATGGYGYYRHDTSTTTSVVEIGIGTTSNASSANLGGNGVMDVLQGKVANTGWLAMNRGDATQYSQLNISGGTFELANSATQVGLFLNNNETHNNKGGQSVINVSGTGSLTSAGTTTELDLMRVSATSATGMLGVLNIGSGGTVQTNVIKATQANGAALVNFNGGTLKANKDAVTILGGSNIDGAYIYSDGAIIDTNGKTVTISQNLLAPTVSGVSSIPVTSNGTGYIGRPVVYLTGGGGSGATAVADFNPATGEVTGITITNPGTGYTSAPTVTITGGGGTAPTLGTVTLSPNTSGGLTKSGTGTLSLTAANSYTGDTTVSEGTLSLGDATNNTSLADNAKVFIAPGAVLNLNYLVGNTDTVKELWIGDVQKPAGVYDLSDASGQITGTGTLTVTNGPTPADPFVAWISAPPYNLTGPSAAFDSDSDNDGITNGLEWILGGNPTQNDNPSILPVVTGNAATGLTLVFNRSADSLPPASTLVIEFDSDLDATWSKSVTVGAANSGPDANGVTVAVDTPSVGKLTVNIPATNASNGRLFARFRAVKP